MNTQTVSPTRAIATTPAPTPTPMAAPLDRGGVASPETLYPIAQAMFTIADVGREVSVGFLASPAVSTGGVILPLSELKQGVW